jgi:hypothetical protein
MVKRTIILAALCCALDIGAFSQGAQFVGSLGGGAGRLSESFRMAGREAELVYAAPAAYLDLELDWDRLYMDMALAVLFPPASATLGGNAVDLSGYELNLAADFTAIGVGWLQPLGTGLSLGGSLGFHVSAPTLSPPGGDPTRLTFEGNYGLIGLCLSPRLRYQIGKDCVLTCTIPFGLDFSPMSEEVILPGGIDSGTTSPAVVAPAGLEPLFRGWTAGIYLSAGYRIPLPF